MSGLGILIGILTASGQLRLRNSHKLVLIVAIAWLLVQGGR